MHLVDQFLLKIWMTLVRAIFSLNGADWVDEEEVRHRKWLGRSKWEALLSVSTNTLCSVSQRCAWTAPGGFGSHLHSKLFRIVFSFSLHVRSKTVATCESFWMDKHKGRWSFSEFSPHVSVPDLLWRVVSIWGQRFLMNSVMKRWFYWTMGDSAGRVTNNYTLFNNFSAFE